jgi:uncharacterized repeat protein (TIGR01451 family)
MIGFGNARRVLGLLATSCVFFVFAATSASAATPAPGWTITSLAMPTTFSAADNATCTEAIIRAVCDTYRVVVRNAGSFEASPGMALSDTLPKGLTVQKITLFWSGAGAKALGPQFENTDWSPYFCHVESGPVSVQCSSFFFAVQPDDTIELTISVTVDEGTPSGPLSNTATVSGGGARTVSTEAPTNQLGGPPAPFGFSDFQFTATGLEGSPDTQAGDHPYELTTSIALDNDLRQEPDGTASIGATSSEDVRDIVTELPVGFVGSILAAPQCTFSQLASRTTNGTAGCPKETIVGHIFTQPAGNGSIDSPIYNMTPERGVPAEFAYSDLLSGTHVFYVHVVPNAQHGYVLEAINPEIPQISLTNILVSFYGDPAQKDGTGNPQIPLFTNPSNCAGEEPTATIYMDSWQNPAKFNPDGTPVNLQEPAWVSKQSKSAPMTGCNLLQFPAEVKAQPTTHEADKPSGMDFEIKLPQSETVGVPATPTLKKAVVTLPEGFTVDPSAGDGLAACSEAQIGWLGGTHLDFSPAAPQCPEASKIGSLELESPLIPHALIGEMFLAKQYENPFGTPEHPGGALLAAYVVVDDPITGVLIKIPGKFEADLHTGRLTAVFDENPNLPFSDLKLHFFGGPRAELATPESCGTFTVGAELTPWSAPDSGPAASPFDDFLIDEACPGGFAPSFTAGSTNLQAGAYTPFVASFGRSDTDQELAGLTVKLPAGLSAIVAGVPECSEAQIEQAEAGTGGCPADSQVGTVKAGAGPGPNPFFATGKAYFTGPYNGGAFGLAVVVPAVAGPFDFGTVVVRQSLRIDPVTAQVTDVSDAFPTIIDGIPLRMRRVDVELNRPGFTFNPTNCEKLGFAGTISGSPLGAPRTINAHTVGYATQAGATSSFTTPFQVTNCAALAFKPGFKVSTTGRTSRAKGASLHVKLTYPKTPFGSQANIRSVKVNLPKQLPSNLKTLQKACPHQTFEANPASCPLESRVGEAKATTPLLPVPLTGPAYFVSYGGAKFPELVIVLSGYGVTLDLHGETFINKQNVTSSTFHTVPDAPVGTFELTLPQGKYSALAAPTPLCGKKLVMPTLFTAQNGATIKQNTPIAISNCPKAKKKHAARARGRRVARARHRHG